MSFHGPSLGEKKLIEVSCRFKNDGSESNEPQEPTGVYMSGPRETSLFYWATKEEIGDDASAFLAKKADEAHAQNESLTVEGYAERPINDNGLTLAAHPFYSGRTDASPILVIVPVKANTTVHILPPSSGITSVIYPPLVAAIKNKNFGVVTGFTGQQISGYSGEKFNPETIVVRDSKVLNLEKIVILDTSVKSHSVDSIKRIVYDEGLDWQQLLIANEKNFAAMLDLVRDSYYTASPKHTQSSRIENAVFGKFYFSEFYKNSEFSIPTRKDTSNVDVTKVSFCSKNSDEYVQKDFEACVKNWANNLLYKSSLIFIPRNETIADATEMGAILGYWKADKWFANWDDMLSALTALYETENPHIVRNTRALWKINFAILDGLADGASTARWTNISALN